jgi:hypothetical protein
MRVRPISGAQGLELVDVRKIFRPCHLIPIPGSEKMIFNQTIDRDMFEMFTQLRKEAAEEEP